MYFGQIRRMEANELWFAKVRNSSQNYCSHDMVFILKVAYLLPFTNLFILFNIAQQIILVAYKISYETN